MTRILVIDNYDSFVYTIVGYLRQMGAETEVVRNDAPHAPVSEYDGVLVSPGPGTPAEAGSSMDVIRDCAEAGVPMLGVCFGHQMIAHAVGGRVAKCSRGWSVGVHQFRVERREAFHLSNVPDPTQYEDADYWLQAIAQMKAKKS